MKEEEINTKKEKKKWNLPKIMSLNVRKTEGGTFSDQTESNYGPINTLS